MAKIEKVKIYFEPQGAVKMVMQVGGQVGIPLHKGIPEAIRTADQILGMGGSLVAYASDKNFDVQVTDEKSDAEWSEFISGKCSENTKWKRWNGETTQGRWNVVVFFGESSGGCFIATAAYDPGAIEVLVLRSFRDEALLHNSIGRAMVGGYYLISPAIAKFISKEVLLKKVTRLFLSPIVFGARRRLDKASQ